MTKTALVLGPTGHFGRNAAQAFEAAGWTVRRFDRETDDLARSAWGAEVILYGWHPPYPDWAEQMPGLTARVIEVARKTGATVIIPGNVYVFGEQTPAPWSETTPHAARNRLGRIRVTMEEAYKRAGVRTIVLRSGDFIDSEASGNWYDIAVISKLAKGRVMYPGNPDIPHAWGYLPDLARAAVALAEKRDELPVFADIPFPGYTLTGREMAGALERITGRTLELRRWSYLPIQLARPFWRMASGILEMRYLWTTPHWLDGTRFHELLPEFRATPIAVALASAIPASVEREVNPDQAMAAGGERG